MSIIVRIAPKEATATKIGSTGVLMAPHDDILFSEIPGKKGNLGEITLNRPKALNALTGDMCRRLHEQLLGWESDRTIKAVVIKGAGDRAFCAGGDIRTLYMNGKEHLQTAEKFFYDEYRMNAAIFHFKKPYIALLDGITMGGGAGVSVHGSHRVATEQLLFAMPETAIGFFPDVGAGYFLSRCKNNMGYYLGLTGDRIRAGDAKWLGLVNHVIPSEKQDALIEALASAPFSSEDHRQVTDIITEFSIELEPLLFNQKTLIESCFAAESVEAIVSRLEERNEEWGKTVLETLLSKSPTSLKVTYEHLTRASAMDFNAIMETEFNIALQFLKTPDFFEGIRAVIINKDQSPKWQPMKLEEVTSERVASYFMKKAQLNMTTV
ncbi:enoyl-CoA hydratase/isomerase family protein [Coxiella burnetii]|uniref:enoyl-CoA hydratase/isomerase family protein n=1 Tax=Coxiella burnetii TaxID=777 RepID=UPI0006932AAA|nr:enoyl-CoA hydratase/isomerase family protein [Coxiella burnetii]ATN85120.1 3-hydroxyisobutyryl-CoA hydrolase [Coxiella burnetii str. Schperling]